MQAKGTRMFRVKAVAEMFDVSTATIYRAIESGQLRALKLGTGKGTVRIPEDAVEEYQKACARAADEALSTGQPTVASDELGEVA